MPPCLLKPLLLHSPLAGPQVSHDLDVAKAQATEKEDLHRIMKDIQEDVGVQAMNLQVGPRSIMHAVMAYWAGKEELSE